MGIRSDQCGHRVSEWKDKTVGSDQLMRETMKTRDCEK